MFCLASVVFYLFPQSNVLSTCYLYTYFANVRFFLEGCKNVLFFLFLRENVRFVRKLTN